mmetsp:Transcript_24081/g.37382  ORF Transcript_24081/g.37382 Transcript_24081/m.37382 type:complete len:202 (-) Transcript_24081:162-767(-)
MSDLTAIVAESVESYARSCANAKEENERLQAELEATRRAALSVARYSGTINITGQGGLPVYACGHFLQDAVFNGSGFEPSDSEGNPVYKFGINLRNLVECPINDVENAEIRVNGVKIALVGDGQNASDTDLINGQHWELRSYGSLRTDWNDIFLDFIVDPIPGRDINWSFHDWSTCNPEDFDNFTFSSINIDTNKYYQGNT